eukprot:NODE_3450_length_666_cov_41.995138_g2458_i0.p5 GENE.NODE_3450_length_666_cov_41.995138_g2458_i0~~NODE_3450_length_666_cov_41.995138_g2458_i0.p5  ORF type:complete len:53 (-),score=5.12 NODE_3450_length_666_cov_41.995138_g2458_i0:333-491(-)
MKTKGRGRKKKKKKDKAYVRDQTADAFSDHKWRSQQTSKEGAKGGIPQNTKK